MWHLFNFNQLNTIIQQEKNNRVLLFRISNKIKQAEARKDNHLASKIREEKTSIDKSAGDIFTTSYRETLQTVSIPIDDFKKNNPDIDLFYVYWIGFEFNASGSEKGAIHLDDISLVATRGFD